jgi:hypothetical protein
VRLVTISGEPRYGDEALLRPLRPAAHLEQLQVGSRAKLLNLRQAGSPLQGVQLQNAVDHLREAMGDLTRAPPPLRVSEAAPGFEHQGEFTVELDMQGDAAAQETVALEAAEIRTSVPLDPLTVLDDAAYFDMVDVQRNLPSHLKGAGGLRQFYA